MDENDTPDIVDGERGRSKTSKGLVVLVCCLLVMIVGLGAAIWVVANNDQIEGNGLDGDVKKIITEYQEKIDNTDNEEEKKALYKDRFEVLIDIMEDSGDDLCMQITSDAGSVIDLSDQQVANEVFEEIPDDCLIRTEPEVMKRVEEPEKDGA